MDKIIDINYVSMNDNLLDITIHNIKESDNLFDSCLHYQSLFVKIDVRGNVSIKRQSVYRGRCLEGSRGGIAVAGDLGSSPGQVVRG